MQLFILFISVCALVLSILSFSHINSQVFGEYVQHPSAFTITTTSDSKLNANADSIPTTTASAKNFNITFKNMRVLNYDITSPSPISISNVVRSGISIDVIYMNTLLSSSTPTVVQFYIYTPLAFKSFGYDNTTVTLLATGFTTQQPAPNFTGMKFITSGDNVMHYQSPDLFYIKFTPAFGSLNAGQTITCTVVSYTDNKPVSFTSNISYILIHGKLDFTF